MDRRDLLRAFASAGALTVLPHRTLEAWSRVASAVPWTPGLNAAQMILVRAVADTIIPATDSPSATDVEVHRFVDVIVAEYATDEERSAFLAGLDAMDARARAQQGKIFADLTPDERGAYLADLERGDRSPEPQKTYWRLKGLIVHGYFTSERVMKDVLKTQVMPGRFEGAAPVKIGRRSEVGGGRSNGAARDAEAHHD